MSTLEIWLRAMEALLQRNGPPLGSSDLEALARQADAVTQLARTRYPVGRD